MVVLDSLSSIWFCVCPSVLVPHFEFFFPD
jgi:hypothetical protein